MRPMDGLRQRKKIQRKKIKFRSIHAARISKLFIRRDTAARHGSAKVRARPTASWPPNVPGEHRRGPPAPWDSRGPVDSTPAAQTRPQQHRFHTRTCQHTASLRACRNGPISTGYGHPHAHAHRLLATRPTTVTHPIARCAYESSTRPKTRRLVEDLVLAPLQLSKWSSRMMFTSRGWAGG